MTLPVEHGYPDYQRQDSRADTEFIRDGGRVIVGQFEFPAFFAGNYSHFATVFSSNTGWFRVAVRYFSDAALTLLLTESEFVVHDGGLFYQSLPVLGPWVVVRVTPGTGPVWNFDTFVWGTSAAFGWLLSPDANQLFSIAQGIGAGATVTFTSLQTMTGVAHISWWTALATWTISFRSLDSVGTSTRRFETNQNGPAAGCCAIALPGEPTEVRLTNGTAALGTMHCAVSVNRSVSY